MGGGGREDPDSLAGQFLDALESFGLAPGDDLLRIEVVGPAHRDLLLVFRSQFEPVNYDVEIPSFESRDELIPLVLNHLGFDTKAGSEGLRKVIFKADEALGMLR